MHWPDFLSSPSGNGLGWSSVAGTDDLAQQADAALNVTSTMGLPVDHVTQPRGRDCEAAGNRWIESTNFNEGTAMAPAPLSQVEGLDCGSFGEHDMMARMASRARSMGSDRRQGTDCYAADYVTGYTQGVRRLLEINKGKP